MLYQSKPEFIFCKAGRYVLCKNMFAHFQNFKKCPPETHTDDEKQKFWMEEIQKEDKRPKD